VLVLDEPTNHLDLEAINALNVALQGYEGTILLVTHDQDLPRSPSPSPLLGGLRSPWRLVWV
jgi:ATPase subunit of ABC transporter with duplicated ATPase domains